MRCFLTDRAQCPNTCRTRADAPGGERSLPRAADYAFPANSTFAPLGYAAIPAARERTITPLTKSYHLTNLFAKFEAHNSK